MRSSDWSSLVSVNGRQIGKGCVCKTEPSDSCCVMLRGALQPSTCVMYFYVAQANGWSSVSCEPGYERPMALNTTSARLLAELGIEYK
jgi:hypothetical protein